MVKKAILLTAGDTVHCGLRSPDEQREHLASGTSGTMESTTLPQNDSHANAVDLVPLPGGKLSWDWSGCYEVARAGAAAAREKGANVRWGTPRRAWPRD